MTKEKPTPQKELERINNLIEFGHMSANALFKLLTKREKLEKELKEDEKE